MRLAAQPADIRRDGHDPLHRALVQGARDLDGELGDDLLAACLLAD